MKNLPEYVIEAISEVYEIVRGMKIGSSAVIEGIKVDRLSKANFVLNVEGNARKAFGSYKAAYELVLELA